MLVGVIVLGPQNGPAHVAFIVLIFPLNALIFRPLLNVMEARDDRIAGNHRRAEGAQRQAEAALERYEESVLAARDEATLERRTRLDAARAEQLGITRTAREEVEREIERAREELEGSLAEARETLRAGSEELARLAAERILGRRVS